MEVEIMEVFWIKAETEMNLQIILKMNMRSHSSFVSHEGHLP